MMKMIAAPLLRLVGLVALIALTAACSHASTAPTAPLPIDLTTPAVLNVGASAGQGIDGGHATISAKVQNGVGAPLAHVLVSFTTTAGTLTPITVETNDLGTASTTLDAEAGVVTVTITAGGLSSRQPVAVQPRNTFDGSFTVGMRVTQQQAGATTAIGLSVSNGRDPFVVHATFGDGEWYDGAATTLFHTYRHEGSFAIAIDVTDALGRHASTSGTALITAAPPPAPPPAAPAAPTPSLTLTLGCVPVSPPGATSCNVAATDETGAVVTSQVTNVAWDWGDGTTSATASVLASRLYAQPGSYLVIAVATGPGGRTGRATKTITIP